MTKWRELERERLTYERLELEQRAAHAELQRLQAEREEAVLRDREALATAIRTEAEQPEDREVRAVDERIAAAHRQLEGLTLALDQQEDVILATVEGHRPTWTAEQVKAVERARKGARAALEAWLEARRGVMEAVALEGWVNRFPEQGSFVVTDAAIAGLRAPHGDPHLFGQVVEALRADAAGPPPAPEQRTMPLARAATAAALARGREDADDE